MILLHTGRYVFVMNKSFSTEFIYKFHQFSNPLKGLNILEGLDLMLLQNNHQNFSKVEFEQYEICKLNQLIIEIDEILNNLNNDECSYFIVYSFYNNKYLQKGNYTYDKTFKQLVKYSELKNEEEKYEFSISFFISMNNAFAKYGNSAYLKSVLTIGSLLKALELICQKRNATYEIKMKNFNKANFDLGIDRVKCLYVSNFYIKE